VTDEVRLQRSLPGRLFAGSAAQWVLTLVVLLEIGLIAVVASIGDLGKVLPSLGAAVIVLLIWLAGVLAAARVDADGIRWRYYAAHDYSWSQVERVRFGGKLIKGSVQFGQAAIFITVAGREHAITPAYGCGRERLIEFGDALINQARLHHVGVSLDTTDRRWDGLRSV
jgi:hypothetical protein